MRSFRKTQNGASLITVVAMLALAALIAIFVLKLTPIYIENSAVASVLTNLKGEGGGLITRDSTKGSIIQILNKRFGMNNIESVFNEDIQVIREPNYVIITIEYEVRTKFISNIDLAVLFSDSVEIEFN